MTNPINEEGFRKKEAWTSLRCRTTARSPSTNCPTSRFYEKLLLLSVRRSFKEAVKQMRIAPSLRRTEKAVGHWSLPRKLAGERK